MNIEVDLKHFTPLSVIVGAIRQCYDSGDKSDSFFPDVAPYPYFRLGLKDKALVKRIIEHGHTSTLEHCYFNFQIKGISRLNLQELARHRMASLSVKSTRYTLKELKNEEPFYTGQGSSDWTVFYDRASKYINLPEEPENTKHTPLNFSCVSALESLRQMVNFQWKEGELAYTNDQTKYALPECYKVDLYWTINIRSLINFLKLRLSPQAHFEIRELAEKIQDKIPEDFKFIFEEAK